MLFQCCKSNYCCFEINFQTKRVFLEMASNLKNRRIEELKIVCVEFSMVVLIDLICNISERLFENKISSSSKDSA